MAILAPQPVYEGVEEFPGPQRPGRVLLAALMTNMFTQVDQNMAVTGHAVNYGYLPIPQRYNAAGSSFNNPMPVHPATAPTIAATSRHNSILEL